MYNYCTYIKVFCLRCFSSTINISSKRRNDKGPTFGVCIRPSFKRAFLSYFGKVFKSKRMNSEPIIQSRGDFQSVRRNSFGIKKIFKSVLSNLNWIICEIRWFEISVWKYNYFVRKWKVSRNMHIVSALCGHLWFRRRTRTCADC